VTVDSLPVGGLGLLCNEYGVSWNTLWKSVTFHVRPLVEDPGRVGPVRALGVNEHSYLSAKPTHPTIYATTFVDLDRRHVVDRDDDLPYPIKGFKKLRISSFRQSIHIHHLSFDGPAGTRVMTDT